MSEQWDQWYAELLKLAQELQPTVAEDFDYLDYVTGSGEEAWRAYFDNDYSPRDALDEDRSYWDD